MTVAVERLIGVYKNMTRGIVAPVYRCHSVAGTAGPTTEWVAVEWLTAEQAAERLIPAYAIRVLDALATEPVSRARDGVTVLQAR